MTVLKVLQKILKFTCYGIIGVVSICIVMIGASFSYLKTRDFLYQEDYYQFMKQCIDTGHTYQNCHFKDTQME